MQLEIYQIINILINIFNFLLAAGVVYLGYRIIIYSILKTIKNRNIPSKAIDGIKLILRLFSLLIVLALFLSLIGTDPIILLSITTVTGIIIGFASTEIVNQIVLGMYIISSEPFRINDLVNINDIEGVVLEIGINYTTLERFDGVIVRIPNKKVMESKIQNYTGKLTEDSDQFPFQIQNEKQENSFISLRDFFTMVKKRFNQSQITHYTFTINVEYKLSPQEVRQRLDRVCDKYKHVFKYRPHYSVIGMSWRPEILFELFSVSSYLILHNYHRFMADLAFAIDENQGGAPI